MSLLLHQFRAEQRLYWRSHELAFFTFIFPLLIYVLLGSVYGDDPIEGEGVAGSAYLLAGILGYGAAATAFAGLAILVVIRRESGVLKRLRGTPLPAWAYVLAVLVSTVVVFVIEAVALILLAKLMFDVPFPERWLSLALALLLGRGRLRGARRRADDVHPLGGGRLGGDQRRLPADGVPRRIVLDDRRRIRPCSRRSRTSCR